MPFSEELPWLESQEPLVFDFLTNCIELLKRGLDVLLHEPGQALAYPHTSSGRPRSLRSFRKPSPIDHDRRSPYISRNQDQFVR